ncbi:UNVERIFIED_CONTAM: hypothetical protein RMT77_008488 [Armadillidium vulgare]
MIDFRLCYFILASFALKVYCLDEVFPQDFSFWNENDRTINFRTSKESVWKSCPNGDSCHDHKKGIPLVNWGLTLKKDLKWSSCKDGEKCLDFGVAKVVSSYANNCETIQWMSWTLLELKDCVNLTGLGHWYGGGQQYRQPWPVESNPREEVPFVTADMLNDKHLYGSVSERFWLSSYGIFVRVDDDVPLFFSMPDEDGDGKADQMCFSSRYERPFVSEDSNSPITLTYHLCYGDDIRQVYELSFPQFFSYPNGIPDEKMMTFPIWSTWAEYQTDINESKVLQFARSIKEKGFPNCQVEIDDKWETCYGDALFDSQKFPDPKNMVNALHEMGFRVTLWIHPFINNNCQSFSYADQKKYLIKDKNGNTQLTSWWQGKNIAGIIDFTNDEAVSWWTGRLKELLKKTGLDGFKFDAGETFWLPKNYTLEIEKKFWPNAYSTSYVDAVSNFGNICEVRVGYKSQKHPLFVRMLDKNSLWSSENGLRTLIPSLLHSGLLGYPFVLPDMVGGNAYEGKPSPELFVRWVQANTFMPSIQFSLLPWQFENQSINVSKISLEVSSLHSRFAPLLIDLAKKTLLGKGPIVRPTWWLCPMDEECLLADQQFLVGDDLLVTPVVIEAATSLDVVFPPGKWKRSDGDGQIYEGVSKQTLYDISIESNIYFERI